MRKRRISILICAQTKGQIHLIYGNEGTQALFTGLATQEGSGDDKYSRSRPLLTVDEVITPQIGNCTIFARYVEAGFATQVVLNARLTRFYEREDWKRRLRAGETIETQLERGILLDLPTLPPAPAEEVKEIMLDDWRQIQRLKEPTNIQELLKWNRESGTHSILEMTLISKEPEFGTVSPLSAEELREQSGTLQPTHKQIEIWLNNDDMFQLRRRWIGLYIIVFEDENPTEICFAGFSGD